MKTVRKVLVGAILAGFVAAAQAIPTTLTNPAPVTHNIQVDNGVASFSYDLALYGFDPLQHSLDSALLSLVFGVTGNNTNQINNANSSIVTISLPGQDSFASSVSSFDSSTPPLITIGFDALNFASGVLNFSLTRSPNPGNVVLTTSTLTVSASLLTPPDGGNTDQVTAVPEPGTLALLGLGLAGLAAGMRRRRRT